MLEDQQNLFFENEIRLFANFKCTDAMCTLRIQLIATAPGADRFLETPTEFRSVCVVKTPIAPPKKCYNEHEIHQYCILGQQPNQIQFT